MPKPSHVASSSRFLPPNIDGTKIGIGVSIGIALSVEGSKSGQELLANADYAMYGAKEKR